MKTRWRVCPHSPVIELKDSYKFLSQSISRLTSDAAEEIHKGQSTFARTFRHLHKYLEDEGLLKFIPEKEVLCKLVFPYAKYSGDIDAFLNSTECPKSKADWPVLLSNESIDDETIERFQRLWGYLTQWKRATTGNPQALCTFRLILEVYTNFDILLLCDHIERHSITSFENFQCDMFALPSISGFAYFTFLKSILPLRLRTVLNSQTWSMWLASIYGGLCMVGHRRRFSSNLSRESDYDPQKCQSICLQLDHVSMYASVMSVMALPIEGGRFLTRTELNQLHSLILDRKILDLWNDSWAKQEFCPKRQKMINIGYLITASFTIGNDELTHQIFDSIPLLYARANVNASDWMSSSMEKQKEALRVHAADWATIEKINKRVGQSKRRFGDGDMAPDAVLDAAAGNQKVDGVYAGKIIGYTGTMVNITLDYRVILFLTLLNYKCTHISGALAFECETYAANFVNYNAAKRRASTNTTQSNFYKAVSNHLFGKTISSREHYVRARLVTTPRELRLNARRKSFSRFHSYGGDIGLAIHKPLSYRADNPCYFGATVLSLSKLLALRWMYFRCKPEMERRFLGVDNVYIDTDAFSVTIHDFTASNSPYAASGVRYPFQSWMPSQKELDAKAEMRRRAQSSNWGCSGQRDLRLEKYDERDPAFFEHRVWDGMRALAPQWLDLSNATSENDPIFSYGTTDAERQQLWSSRNANKKKYLCWTLELGTDVYIKHYYGFRSKFYIFETRRYTDQRLGVKRRCKGAQKGALEHVSIERYLKALVGWGKFNRIFEPQSFLKREKGYMTLVKQNRCLGHSFSDLRYWYSRQESFVYGSPWTQHFRIVDSLLLEMVELVVQKEEEEKKAAENPDITL